MIIDKSKFANKADLVNYVTENYKDIILLKKSAIKHCEALSDVYIKVGEAGKAKPNEAGTKLTKTIVGNTYGWLDSHDDVHINGIFTKTIQENKSKILFLHDHENKVNSRVGKFSDIYEQKTNWRALGVDLEGSTTCLLADAIIDKDLNSTVYTLYKDGAITQHSVGMRYINLYFCLNSHEQEHKEYLGNWNKYISQVGNQDKAKEQGYFFAVTEAALMEISAVNSGSNELTPTFNEKQAETKTLATTETEAAKSTSKYQYDPNTI